MHMLKETLHQKRKATEEHIRQLQKNGTPGVRYAAMMPDIPFLIFGLLNDIGWLTQLTADVLYFCRNEVRFVSDALALAVLAAIQNGRHFCCTEEI